MTKPGDHECLFLSTRRLRTEHDFGFRAVPGNQQLNFWTAAVGWVRLRDAAADGTQMKAKSEERRDALRPLGRAAARGCTPGAVFPADTEAAVACHTRDPDGRIPTASWRLLRTVATSSYAERWREADGRPPTLQRSVIPATPHTPLVPRAGVAGQWPTLPGGRRTAGHRRILR